MTERAQREAEAGSWTTNTELLATVAELISATNAILIKANSKKGSADPEVLRIPRPYEQSEQNEAAGEVPVVSGAEIARLAGEG